MDEPPRSGRPRLALLRRRLPYAERDEVVTDLAAEYRVRVAREGGVAGRAWAVERTVVGVMPKGFWFPDPGVRVWLAQPLDAEERSGNYALVGRLAAGAPPAEVAAALRQVTPALRERFDYPDAWDKTKNATLTPLREALVGKVRPTVLATVGAMAVILLMACANVAALMLGQVDQRASELAVRAALGAGRRRLLQQLVGEAVVVGLLAGAAGAALAAAGFRVLVGALPLGALAEGATLDWTVLWAAMAIAVVAALAVTLVPASSLWRGDVRGALTRQRTSGIGGRGGRVEGGLVVAEVGLAVIMAAGAALLVRSVANLQAIDPGVDTRGVAVLDVVVPPEETEAQRRQDFRTLAAELAKLPGVRSAGVAAKLPLRGPSNNWGIRIEGEPNRPPSTTFYRVVSPAYFRTMGIRILSGRGFVAGDAVIPDSLETPVVINRALARKYFPGQDPLGRRIGGGRGWARIVGVVDDVAEGDLEPSPGPARYVLFEHSPWVPSAVSLVVRVAQGWDETAILAQARRAIRRVAPGVAIQEATTMRQVFTHAVGPARQLLSLLGMLAGLALALGAVGVISHFVSRRKREWGIRMALGLPPRRILAQVVGRGGALVALGAVLGMLVSLGLARLLSTFLYGVRPADPLSLAAATGGLLLVGVVAALVPARRAATTDPAVVLRET